MFNEASGFVIKNTQISQTINFHSCKETGLGQLFQISIPEAAHDSRFRVYSPRCFPGTREQHVEDFTSWVAGAVPGRFQISWMHGPAGVGKSAIAQTCAEKLEGSLAAAFFFSGPNQAVDPDRVFPSIAHQISTKFRPFATILDEKIRKNPSLLTKSVKVQFRELIVAPLLELGERGVRMREKLVVVDGLDECGDDRAQCTIIELVAAAVRDHGVRLPLVWAFFTRPEPHIVQAFTSPAISPLVRVTVLPVSREVDGEIEVYLRGEFENISKRHGHLSLAGDAPWPSDDDIMTLVGASCGLFIFAATTIKFIADPDALDPRELLKIVLSTCSGLPSPTALDGHPNPMAGLDALYLLIMRRIPVKILPVTLRILLLWSRLTVLRPLKPHAQADRASHILGLNSHSFAAALSKLHSVLAIVDNKPKFYHASFLEFLVDINRSGPDFYIQQPQHYTFLAKRGFVVMAEWCGEDPMNSTTSMVDMKVRAHMSVTACIFHWLASADLETERDLVTKLKDFDFRQYFESTSPLLQVVLESCTFKALFNAIPPCHRNQIITQYSPRYFFTRDSNRLESEIGFTLGRGGKSIKLEFDTKGALLRHSSGPENLLRDVDFYRRWKF